MIYKVIKFGDKIEEGYLDEIIDWNVLKDAFMDETKRFCETIAFNPRDTVSLSCCCGEKVMYMDILSTYMHDAIFMYVNLEADRNEKYYIALSHKDTTIGVGINLKDKDNKALTFENACEFITDSKHFMESHPILKLAPFEIKDGDLIETRIKDIYKNNGIYVFRELITNKSMEHDENMFDVFGVLITLNTNKTVTMEDILKK